MLPRYLLLELSGVCAMNLLTRLSLRDRTYRIVPGARAESSGLDNPFQTET